MTARFCHLMLIVFWYQVAAGQSYVSAGGIFNQQLYGKCNNEILLTREPRCRPAVANNPIQTRAALCVLLMNYASASLFHDYILIMKFPEPLVAGVQLCLLKILLFVSVWWSKHNACLHQFCLQKMFVFQNRTLTWWKYEKNNNLKNLDLQLFLPETASSWGSVQISQRGRHGGDSCADCSGDMIWNSFNVMPEVGKSTATCTPVHVHVVGMNEQSSHTEQRNSVTWWLMLVTGRRGLLWVVWCLFIWYLFYIWCIRLVWYSEENRYC